MNVSRKPIRSVKFITLTFLIRCHKYKRPKKLLDLHSSFRATEYNSINFTSWTSATCVTSPFARARKAFNVKAVSDGNIAPAIQEYPEPSTAPLYSLERESSGGRCVLRFNCWRTIVIPNSVANTKRPNWDRIMSSNYMTTERFERRDNTISFWYHLIL